ncbi:MAG: 3-phosphoshikimate 1-carboxyvinyltransferase [Desulfovibrio sp.]|nr:3-phosphoshikimate 1-carboxyvinyltransferase [Desulfovibrio sp.]
MNDTQNTRPRRLLRDVVCDLDKDILKLLLRRYNLVRRMYNTKGFLDLKDEKILRASWQTAVARVSKDFRLAGNLFALLQDITFLPRPAPSPEGSGPDGDGQTDSARREHVLRSAFNLAPPQKPVRLHMAAPFACRATRAYLMLAAATGQAVRISPCLMNDPIVDFVKALNQAGASLTRENEGVFSRESAPLGVPDKVLHVGDSAWNFFLLLAHYLGRPSRVKFTGETALKMTDFSITRLFLPLLGARLVSVVPKSEGLPVRLECSGMFPESVSLPADLPAEFAQALLLAAPLYAKPLSADFGLHPQRDGIFARTLPLLSFLGARHMVDGATVHITPGPLSLPAQPDLPLEPELANFFLALPLALGGEARLAGFWPHWSGADSGVRILQGIGLELREENGEVRARAVTPLRAACLSTLPADLPPEWFPLPAALAACAALRGGEALLPKLFCYNEEVDGFLRALGLEMSVDGHVFKAESCEHTVWNAPTPVWALAFALAACAKPHRKLGNPGCVTELYPAFWSLYNALPDPAEKVVREEKSRESAVKPVKRRIKTE